MEIAVVGVFDVHNLGDLLFPMVVASQLARRIPGARVRCYSMHGRPALASPERLGYPVHPLTDLPRDLPTLDALVIGGGDVIRFDPWVAPDYRPPSRAIPHPTGFWLVPALAMARSGRPVVWNSPGVVGSIPRWARPLVTELVTRSSHVSVRDARSALALHQATGLPIPVAPDSGVHFAELLEETADGAPTGVLPSRSLLVHASPKLMPLAGAATDIGRAFDGAAARAMLVGTSMGDCDDALAPWRRRVAVDPPVAWSDPLDALAQIRDSAGVVSASLHLSIAAVGFGLPALHLAPVEVRKHALLHTVGFRPVRSISAALADPSSLGDGDLTALRRRSSLVWDDRAQLLQTAARSQRHPALDHRTAASLWRGLCIAGAEPDLRRGARRAGRLVRRTRSMVTPADHLLLTAWPRSDVPTPAEVD